ncbi:PH domain-containing protein [Actinotalea sp. Marseille-Q4924]|uniref:PH domain-containing protein n=1 Tax=Actinotalea sp. Marseille-Q4924 TaxID=2866571 RepID=UPI001CE44DCE|nr:PH domain-containing protein [Actinotalea sp. Marseille-Q4924]
MSTHGDRHGGDPYRPFRPRAARWVSTVVAVVFAVVIIGLSFVVPSYATVTVAWLDRLGFALVAAGGALLLLRHAAVRADPSPEGLRVRNLTSTRTVTWAEIVSVRFGHGHPWVQLDLADGETLAVMGIQRADGARAVAEAKRLATLVARHSETSRDD